MTTAHRPTWQAALGGNGVRDGSSGYTTRQLSVRDLTAHTLLKLRQPGQNAPEEILANKELRRELFAKERQSRELYGNMLTIENVPAGDEQKQADNERKLLACVDDGNPDADVAFGSISEHEEEPAALSDEDEEAELMRELERIKRERAKAEAAKRASEQQRILTNNPLLSLVPPSPNDEFVVKRHWDDDVVFKNQSKGIDERPKKRFINDTTRSDFHRKFLDRYIK